MYPAEDISQSHCVFGKLLEGIPYQCQAYCEGQGKVQVLKPPKYGADIVIVIAFKPRKSPERDFYTDDHGINFSVQKHRCISTHLKLRLLS